MSSEPKPTGLKDYENPVDVIPVVKKIKDIRKFVATREAILAGEKLYLLKQSDLTAREMMVHGHSKRFKASLIPFRGC
jgi:hypothetical protein